ncbi:MAG: hypothetical protein ACPGJI_06680, partial [Kangiellaceae bacterium]
MNNGSRLNDRDINTSSHEHSLPMLSLPYARLPVNDKESLPEYKVLTQQISLSDSSLFNSRSSHPQQFEEINTYGFIISLISCLLYRYQQQESQPWLLKKYQSDGIKQSVTYTIDIDDEESFEEFGTRLNAVLSSLSWSKEQVESEINFSCLMCDKTLSQTPVS